MKALILAAAFAALHAPALAGAAHEAGKPALTDTATTTVMADASRIGSASLTALNPASHWTPAQEAVSSRGEFEGFTDIDLGALVSGVGVLALLLARPASRLLRRQEQQRRATALASTLGHSPRG